MGNGQWGMVGIPQMWFLRFADVERERRFLLACADRGFLLKRGAYNFPSLAHGEAEVKGTLDAVRDAWADSAP
jgi:glutamate-1-semialdehyde aminotransferase